MDKERWSSRFNFLLLAAGGSIGIGNIWRFPYLVSRYGGGIYIIAYLIFLGLLGLPLMVMELAVGRGSGKSIFSAFSVLEKEEQRWHVEKYIAIAGNFLMIGVYVPIGGWSLYYFFQTVLGHFNTGEEYQVNHLFQVMAGSQEKMLIWAFVIIMAAFFCCRRGLKEGVERVCRIMVLLLFIILFSLVGYTLFLDGGTEALVGSVKINWNQVMEAGIWKMLESAMSQALFSLGLGIGIMTLLGSFLDKSHSLLGESVRIAGMDTVVSLLSAACIIPICFIFGKDITEGPELVFQTLPEIFGRLPYGRLWGSLFFLVMIFAIWTTVIILFENLTVMFMERYGWSRENACNRQLLLVIGVTAAVTAGISLFSKQAAMNYGMALMTTVDMVLSNILLPFGALLYIFGCISKIGWGFSNFKKEVNAGQGMKISEALKGYLKIVLPVVIIVLMVIGWLK